MGKSLRNRLQKAFSWCPFQTKQEVPIKYSAPYLARNVLSSTPETVRGINAMSGINLASLCAVVQPELEGLKQDNLSKPKGLSPFRRLLSRFGVANGQKIIKDVIVRGTLAQDSIGPFVTNRQCTTMAYQSLIYQAAQGRPDTWTSQDIDTILRLGHRQHQQFRFVDKLSTHRDGKVGVYQLPNNYRVKSLPMFCSSGDITESMARNIARLRGAQVTRLSDVDGCYGYESREIAEAMACAAPEFPFFMANAFPENCTEAVNMVLTIGEFSMAIWRAEGDSRLWLFDSHRRGPTGGAHVPGTVLCPGDPGAALVRSFQDLDSLIAHLVQMAGTNFAYSAALFNIQQAERAASNTGTGTRSIHVKQGAVPDTACGTSHHDRLGGSSQHG